MSFNELERDNLEHGIKNMVYKMTECSRTLDKVYWFLGVYEMLTFNIEIIKTRQFNNRNFFTLSIIKAYEKYRSN